MNEMVKAPSPTSRLQRLGIRKATKKASAAIPVPKKWAVTISLKNPRIRLRSVPIPIVDAALVIVCFSDTHILMSVFHRPDRLDTSYPKMLKKSIN
jgi:hypothetical protein